MVKNYKIPVMQSDTESVVLKYLREGDVRVFEQCYNTYRKPLQAAAFVLLQDEEEAKDVVQELFIDLWEKKSYMTITGSVKSYLFIAVKNRCLNQLRKTDIRRKHLANILLEPGANITTTPDNRLEQRQEREELSAALQQLLHPQTYRVVELAYLDGKNRKEIAAETGTSPNTIRNQLVRAMDILRKNFLRQ
jgi:RNA polymerase sigma-70 factor (ECF subfamily)